MQYPLTIFSIISIALLFTACSATTTTEEVDASGFRTIYTIDKKTGKKNGPVKVMDNAGNLIEEATYVDDQLNGIRVLYDEAGDTTVTEYYEVGQFEGMYRVYHPGGGQVKLSGQYTQNVMVGQWRKYYASGQLQEVVTFAENQENGPFWEWFEDGTLAAEGSYRDGDNEQGRLRVYNTDGSLNRVMECDMGICRSIWRDTFPGPPPVREIPDFE